jgi:hypothetical protein
MLVRIGRGTKTHALIMEGSRIVFCGKTQPRSYVQDVDGTIPTCERCRELVTLHAEA